MVGIVMVSLSASGYEHPGGMHTTAQLDHARKQIVAGAAPFAAAWTQLLGRADKALAHTPRAVAEYSVPGYYRDSAGHKAARAPLRTDADAAFATALAWAIDANLSAAKKQEYGAKTVEILNDWARTNTMISGYDGPLTFCYQGCALMWAAELIWHHSGWHLRDRNKFVTWARSVAYQAANIKTTARNNWAAWGIAMALSIDHLTDNAANMAADTAVLRTIIDTQIATDGTLPGELSRGTGSLRYTVFALKPMTVAMEIVRNSGGPDLFEWSPPSGGTVRAALDFLWQHAVISPGTWPGGGVAGKQTLSCAPNGYGADLFEAMQQVYDAAAWRNWVSRPIYSPRENGWIAPTLLVPGLRQVPYSSPTPPASAGWH
jgi:hypothetical protein